jgi:hypothetical protein
LDPKASPKRGPRPFTERRVNSLRTRRDRLPWPTDKPYRILSLDGGGIRGIYAATILADIEAEITTGEPIASAPGFSTPTRLIRSVFCACAATGHAAAAPPTSVSNSRRLIMIAALFATQRKPSSKK